MWYKINVIRTICDIKLMFIINHTLTDWQHCTTVIRTMCDIRLNVYNKPHTDGLTTVIPIICDIRLMFIINHTLTDWQR